MTDIEARTVPVEVGGRALAAVGLSEAEENTYLVLLEHPGAALAEVADLTGRPRRQASRLLATLEAKGMLTRSLDSEPRFQPTPPEAAVEALIAQRQYQLEAARHHAERLGTHARATAETRRGQESVEMVTGGEAIASYWERLHADATEEGLLFLRSRSPQADEAELDALARGVRVRAIYDRYGLVRPGVLDGLHVHVAAGEQARVFAPVPVEMVIADRDTAVLSLANGTSEGVALLLRPCGLLDALLMFFEAVWRQATPFRLYAAGESEQHTGADTALPADVDRILPLLAVGLKDDCIARELGISARTLDRRLRVMMRAWGAATRFQAGWLAASRHQPLDEPDSGRRRAP